MDVSIVKDDSGYVGVRVVILGMASRLTIEEAEKLAHQIQAVVSDAKEVRKKLNGQRKEDA